MSFDRLIDLYQLLANHSTLASRGMSFRLEGEAVKIRRDDALVGKWTHNGTDFVFSTPACPATRVQRETVTQAVAFVMDSLRA